jgi:hypothetical protein
VSKKSTTPAPITGIATSGQGQTTAGEGRQDLTAAQLAQAIDQFCNRQVQLAEHRHKPEPKCSEAQFRSARALGLSESEQMEMLEIQSRSTLYSYIKKWPAKKIAARG